MKRGSELYAYLEKTGVLKNGSNEDIKIVKKKYWAEVRKEWKRQKRQECKSYTVFFTKPELRQVTNAIKNSRGGVTAFIKQAALAHAADKTNIDKHFIGMIREELAIHYNNIQEMEEEKKINPVISEAILNQIVKIENKLLG